MKWLALSAVLAAIATPVSAEPIFLQCAIAYADGTSRAHVNVNLNEAAETAGITIVETGYSPQKMPAVFSPDTVEWKNGDGAFVTEYSIDRTTLILTERHLTGGEEAISARRTGECAIPPRRAAKRKF